jgi:hypothetical protein
LTHQVFFYFLEFFQLFFVLGRIAAAVTGRKDAAEGGLKF